jgi:hypothetical protein
MSNAVGWLDRGADAREPRSPLMSSKNGRGSAWQVWVGILVGLGMIATAAVAIVETYWG